MAFRVLDDYMLVQLAAAPITCDCPMPREMECDVNRCAQCWATMERLLTYANTQMWGRDGMTISKVMLRRDIRWHPAIWAALRQALLPPLPVPAPAPAAAPAPMPAPAAAPAPAPMPAPIPAAAAAPMPAAVLPVVNVTVVVQICGICLDEMNVGRYLICVHRFHEGCVNRWLRRSRTCPVCRTPQP